MWGELDVDGRCVGFELGSVGAGDQGEQVVGMVHHERQGDLGDAQSLLYSKLSRAVESLEVLLVAVALFAERREVVVVAELIEIVSMEAVREEAAGQA